MTFYLYILRFENNRLYIGQTNNLPQRLKDHKSKSTRSSKYSKENGQFNLVYKESFETRIQSMHREKQLKGWSRAKKEALIANNMQLLKKL